MTFNNKAKKIMSSVGLSLFAFGLTTPLLVPVQAEASTVDRIVDRQTGGIATRPNAKPTIKVDENGNQYYSPSGEFESVNAKDASNWASRKGSDAVGVLQEVGKWLAIIIFIISFIMLAVGAIAKGDWFKRGLVGLAISVVMWAGVLFAPELVHFFTTWLAS